MPTTLATRKPVDALVPEDLTIFPLWEFASGEEGVPGRDETWVRPLPGRSIPNDGIGLLVAADFTTPVGRPYFGIATVNALGGLTMTPAALFLFDRYCFFALAVTSLLIPGRNLAELRKEFRILDPFKAVRGLPGLGAVLPMRYRLSVPITGETWSREGVSQGA